MRSFHSPHWNHEALTHCHFFPIPWLFSSYGRLIWPQKRELLESKGKWQQAAKTEWFIFQGRGPYSNRPFSYLGSEMSMSWCRLCAMVATSVVFLKSLETLMGEWFHGFWLWHVFPLWRKWYDNLLNTYHKRSTDIFFGGIFVSLFLLLEERLMCLFCLSIPSEACCSLYKHFHTHLYISMTCIF